MRASRRAREPVPLPGPGSHANVGTGRFASGQENVPWRVAPYAADTKAPGRWSGCLGSPPAIIRQSSRSPPHPATGAHRCASPDRRRRPGHHRVRVGEAAHLRQVRDDQHLGIGRQPRETARADVERRARHRRRRTWSRHHGRRVTGRPLIAGITATTHHRTRPWRSAAPADTGSGPHHHSTSSAPTGPYAVAPPRRLCRHRPPRRIARCRSSALTLREVCAGQR